MQPTPGPSNAEVKSQLEIEKLRVELQTLRSANRPWSLIARNVTVFTAILTAVSVGIGLFQFNRQQQATARREEAGRAEELRKTYWQEQKRAYDQAANAAASIASASALKEVPAEVRQFWALYWGGMSLIESPEVERAMIDFGNLLSAWERSGTKPDEVKNISYRVAHCMKQSLAKTWRPVTGGTVLDAACPYAE
jgi:hypothetical protein